MTAELTFRPIAALVATFEVVDSDGRVIGVIASIEDGDWRVLSTRHGSPEPTAGSFPTREAAAATLLEP